MGMSNTLTSPQEDVSRRLQALSDLLKLAANDNDNANVHLKKQTERCKHVVEQDFPEDLPETPQEWDEDIISLTKQLMECRQDTPEKMEIEERPQARVTYKPERRSRRPKEEKKKPKATKIEEEPQDRREQLQREMSEMSYPKIGPGYSDTVSVMSDLSIPTVVTNLYVPDEEYYTDLPPPVIQKQTGMIPKRQPSIGSNMMEAPPDREDESTLMAPSLIAPSIVSAPSIVAPSVAAPSLAAEHEFPHRVASPIKKTPGGAAAQRRQTHQAVLAHLQQQPVSALATAQRRSSMPGRISPNKTNNATMTVNDLPPLNFPNADEPSEYGLRKPNGGKRRSLLGRGNKYAASVTATSTRMLLSSSQKKTATPTKRSSLLHRGSKKDDSVGSLSPNSNLDIDGVLSTMNGDIDWVFQEMAATEQDDDDASNIGSTAKIKYNLTSVARTLRPKDDGKKKNDALVKQNVKEEANWGSIDLKMAPNSAAAAAATANKSDPLLIDEDGFIVSDTGDDGGFNDPFAPTNMKNDPFSAVAKSKNEGNPFADSFFPPGNTAAAKKESKKKAKRKTSSAPVDATKDISYSPGEDSTKTKESRIDAVELATKKRIEMLRKLVEYRARHVSQHSNRTDSVDGDELEKLDFVEAETMKQIARLRDRLGASRRELGQE